MQELIRLSPTVERARDQLADKTAVKAVDIVRPILAAHKEYARKAPRPKLAVAAGVAALPVDKWLAEVRSLFNSTRAPELHGRLVILGLSILEPDLKQQLDAMTFLPRWRRNSQSRGIPSKSGKNSFIKRFEV